MERMKAAIDSAELVLVGLGEELDTGLSVLRAVEPYRDYLKEVEAKPGTEWLIPYMFSHYLAWTADGKRRIAYEKLACLLQNKNYFIVTTCMDGRIAESSLKKERITAPCGDYRRLQCSGGCPNNLMAAEEVTEQVWKKCEAGTGCLEQIDRPVCSVCSKPLLFNHIQEAYEEEGYLSQWKIYTKWLQGTLNKRLCVLELGVGMKYPTVIRWPFEKAAFFNQKSSFIRVHHSLYQMSEQLTQKGVSIPENSLDFLVHRF